MDRGPAARAALRATGVAVGAVLLITVGVYAPLVLSAPAPPVNAEQVTVTAGQPTASPPLPEAGSNALVLSGEPLAQSGDPAPRALGGAVKAVTALLVLEAHPLRGTEPGPTVTITPEDVARTAELADSGARVVPVVTGQRWTQRELLAATLVGSANNLAEVMAVWAFGSLERYLAATAAWLEEHGLSGVGIADATGLSAENLGTAKDLAGIAQLALETEAIASVLADGAFDTAFGLHVQDSTVWLAEEGVSTLSRSYTHESAIVLLFGIEVAAEVGSVTLYGAFLGSPTWERLREDVTALAAAARENIDAVRLVEEGAPVAAYSTPWGSSASAVAGRSLLVPGWAGTTPDGSVRTEPISGGRKGTVVGAVTFELSTGPVSIPLVLEQTLRGPDPWWRVTHPLELLPQ